MASKQEQMAAKMGQRNPLEKRASITPVDVMQKPQEDTPTVTLKPKKEVANDSETTESMFFRATKEEKRFIKLYALENNMFAQDVIRDAIREYTENHPIN